ncbi:uncharacterized protein LOC125756989 [Rhipicephalus sanguineus]|uniref:Oxidative stress-responsive serine-rich protein 1 n=1 Tax=Rhipicephalus sanguineus TaxID=34632 RepID=A0A9D4T6T8_RHISA|nr:uncharacterized protein LOC125756989 [Rhipicephalus sanguineus]KAH7982324.1 hypothetical protein HPB52_004087 [Rhipicephalus sanguineus]
MAAAQGTGSAEPEDTSKKRVRSAPSVLDDLDTAIKKLKVSAKKQDGQGAPDLPRKPRKSHLLGPSRRLRSRRPSKSTSETSVTPNGPAGASAEQGAESTCPGSFRVNSVKESSSAPDLTCEPPIEDDTTVNELAAYFENLVHIPRKMSAMAEMMYM